MGTLVLDYEDAAIGEQRDEVGIKPARCQRQAECRGWPAMQVITHPEANLGHSVECLGAFELFTLVLQFSHALGAVIVFAEPVCSSIKPLGWIIIRREGKGVIKTYLHRRVVREKH